MGADAGSWFGVYGRWMLEMEAGNQFGGWEWMQEAGSEVGNRRLVKMGEEKVIGERIMIGKRIMIGERNEIEETKRADAPIRSYRDLRVYQMSYAASIEVLVKLLPLLPKEEKYDLVDQLRRSSKAVPRLIAEGYAKRHQHRGFHKYIDDAMGEANETSVSLSQCRDAYSNYIDKEMCDKLVDTYDRIGRQLYRLRERWRSFGE